MLLCENMQNDLFSFSYAYVMLYDGVGHRPTIPIWKKSFNFARCTRISELSLDNNILHSKKYRKLQRTEFQISLIISCACPMIKRTRRI